MATRSCGLLPPPATASTGDDRHGSELTATTGCRSEMGRSGRCDGDAAPSCSSSHTRSRSSDDGDDNKLLM
ncbi:hypothetical protein DAI22_07g008550 [Oryza sativa Japonica Group]|nr:hypothetical protein DAI22_07g008550 [Oryza sativa Japonica Group]